MDAALLSPGNFKRARCIKSSGKVTLVGGLEKISILFAMGTGGGGPRGIDDRLFTGRATATGRSASDCSAAAGAGAVGTGGGGGAFVGSKVFGFNNGGAFGLSRSLTENMSSIL